LADCLLLLLDADLWLLLCCQRLLGLLLLWQHLRLPVCCVGVAAGS
jgi:hypothetical protein